MIIHAELPKIHPNPWQTRSATDGTYIHTLARDIAANGLMQYPVGRLINEQGEPADFNINQDDPAAWGGDIGPVWQVQLAFGHNRLEAYRWLAESRNAFFPGDWTKMPVDVRALLSDEQMAIMAWSENEKRSDLTPIERARAIARRIDSFGWTHDVAADRLGIARSSVSNTLRLLKLPQEVQKDLQDGVISERQAAALLPLFDIDDQVAGVSEFEFARMAIVGWARDGQSSNTLRERVREALEMLHKKLQPELPPDPRYTEPDHERRETPESEEREGDAVERPVERAVDLSMSEDRRKEPDHEKHETHERRPEKHVETATPPEEAEAGDRVLIQAADSVAAWTWAGSTLELSVTLMAEDGHPDGRTALVGLRANNGTPMMRYCKERELRLRDVAVFRELLEDLEKTMEA
jgi:ParB/RepB/Spo0J family partition protein